MINKFLTMLLMLPIKFYKVNISPFIDNSSRYFPSCSSYAIEALETHGVMIGSLLTAKQSCRCYIWASRGYDPVPGHRSLSKPDDE